MLLQAKPLLYRTPSKSQRQVDWKADNLPHVVGPVRYKLTPAGFDGTPATIGAMRRARPYRHYRYDYIPLLDAKSTQVSADSYVHSASRVFEVPGGAGVTRPRQRREADRLVFPNGMTGSLADETTLQNMHENNNARIAEAARARVRSAGKQKSNKYQHLFTYSSNDEYLQSRARTYHQNQFHYDLAKEIAVQQPSALGKFYRPQGAHHQRLRNLIRGELEISPANNNTRLFFRTADDENLEAAPRMLELTPGRYSFDSLVGMIHERVCAFTDGQIVLSLEFDASANRVLVKSYLQPGKPSAAHFVITPDSQAFWLSLGFAPLSDTTGETSRMLPAQSAISAALQTQATVISAGASAAPFFLVVGCDPVLFHRDRNQDLADSQPLDASANTFRKRYNNIQCAAPSYVSSFGLATATSLVYRKSFQDVYTKKHTFEKKPCDVQCLLKKNPQ